MTRRVAVPLFDLELAELAPGINLVPVGMEIMPSEMTTTCPICWARLALVTHCQPALFYMYGHGGVTERTDWRCQRCGYSRHHSTKTTTPRCAA